MGTILLFFFYLFAATWWLRRDKFLANSGLTPLETGRLFLLKVAIACIYGYIGGGLYHITFDTWTVFKASLPETDMLLKHPGTFFAELVQDPNANLEVPGPITFWRSFQANYFIKVMAVLNLFSSRNYYINALFFSFFTLYGYAFFLRLFLLFRPDAKRIILLSSLLIPGFLFWGSGMYKEGLNFSGICMLVYGCVMVFRKAKYGWIILAGILLLGPIRTYSLILLSPFLLYYIGWRLLRKENQHGFLAGLLLFLGLFFTLVTLLGFYDFTGELAQKRSEFLLLKGNSLLDSRELAPAMGDVLARIPAALEYTLMRPYPWEAFKQLFYFPAALEVLAILLLLIVWIRRKGWKTGYPDYVVLLATFALFNLIVIGLTVPFLGAIVRYKSIYLPFLITPVAIALFTKKSKTK